MVDIHYRRCSHASCKKRSTSKAGGSKTIGYCKQHAKEDIIKPRGKHCSNRSCIEKPVWGVLADGAAAACLRHKRHLVGGSVVNFTARCKEARCSKLSKWGLDGKQPTHCRDHGPLTDGLVCTVKATRNKGHSRSPLHRSVRGTCDSVKSECSF